MGIIIRRTVTPPVTPTVIPMAEMPSGRYYPDGQPIPASLPALYEMSHRCGNCAAYVVETGLCSAYKDIVRAEYVCPSWTAIAA